MTTLMVGAHVMALLMLLAAAPLAADHFPRGALCLIPVIGLVMYRLTIVMHDCTTPPCSGTRPPTGASAGSSAMSQASTSSASGSATGSITIGTADRMIRKVSTAVASTG